MSGEYPAPSLIECEVCAGIGVMTARDVKADPATPPAAVPCPACAGAGATLRPFPPKLEVVRDV